MQEKKNCAGIKPILKKTKQQTNCCIAVMIIMSLFVVIGQFNSFPLDAQTMTNNAIYR